MISNERILFYVACLAFLLTLVEGIKKLFFIKNADKTQGVVINIGVVSSTDGPTRNMRVKFFSENVEYFIDSRVVGNKAFVGEEIGVIFDKNDPRKAYINSWLNLFIFELCIFVISISAIIAFG